MSQDKKSSFSIFFSTLKMGLATFISRILGLAREQIMAGMFGASGLTDAFLVAYRIPNLLRDLFAEGAFSSAFVPIFMQVKNLEDGGQLKKILFYRVFILLFFIVGLISVLIYIFAPNLVSLFAPEYAHNEQIYNVTVNLTKIMAPFLLFVTWAALMMGALNSESIFFIPSLAPAMFNIFSILAMIFLPSILSQYGLDKVYALGLGVFLGGLAQLFFQMPLLIKKGYFKTFPKKIWCEHSIKIFKRLGPGLAGFAAVQINMLVVTIMASRFVGAISWLNYGFRIFQFPVGILGVSLGSSHLIYFSESLKSGNKTKAVETLQTSLYFSMVTMIPICFVMFGLANEMIHLVFERGRFTAHDTLMTAKILKLYALGLPFYGIIKIAGPSLYALDMPKIPVYCSFLSIISNVIFCLILVPHFGFLILALGSSMSTIVNCMGLLIMIKSVMNVPIQQLISSKIFKISAIGFILYGSVQVLSRWLFIFSASTGYKVFSLSLILIIAIFLYVILLAMVGEREILAKMGKKTLKRLNFTRFF